MATVVLFVRARAGKSDFLLTTIGVKVLVDELTAIVRVHTQEPEGKMLPHPMYCLTHRQLTFAPHRKAFRPAAGYIHGTERIQVKALGTLTTMSYQVCFHETRLVLLPVGKGPDGYGILEQAPCPGGAQWLSASQSATGSQQPVDGGRAHPAELDFHRGIDPQLAVLPKHFHHLGHEGLKSLGTQQVTGFPDLFQCCGYSCTIFPCPTALSVQPGVTPPIQ